MKQIKRILIVALILFTAGLNVISTRALYGEDYERVHKNEKIQSLLRSYNEEADYQKVRYLQSADCNNLYVYIPFKSGGYLIYDTHLNLIHEYSTSHGNSYIEDYEGTVFYTGALGYYKKENDGSYVEIPSGRRVGKEKEFIDMAKLKASEIQGRLRETSLAPESISATVNHLITGTVPNYSYNPNGICGSTAAAMLLRWYDLYVNSNYVPSSLQTSTGITLIDHLRPYIDGTTPGSTTGEVYTGILSYCSDQGVFHNAGYAAVSLAYVSGRVDSFGTPYILGVSTSPTYVKHWVTGYGYSTSGGSSFAIVNDGWGNTNVSINLVNCDFIIW